MNFFAAMLVGNGAARSDVAVVEAPANAHTSAASRIPMFAAVIASRKLPTRVVRSLDQLARRSACRHVAAASMERRIAGSSISYLMVTTVFQQIEVSVSMISGLILFGLGAALGRRRTYRIYRSENRN
jgi:hypothetical protein